MMSASANATNSDGILDQLRGVNNLAEYDTLAQNINGQLTRKNVTKLVTQEVYNELQATSQRIKSRLSPNQNESAAFKPILQIWSKCSTLGASDHWNELCRSAESSTA